MPIRTFIANIFWNILEFRTKMLACSKKKPIKSFKTSEKTIITSPTSPTLYNGKTHQVNRGKPTFWVNT